MAQDMVARSLSDPDFSTAANGSLGQAPSPYKPKYMLLKMPYRFMKSDHLLAPSNVCVLCG
jgi:hypothetical protein